MANSRSAIARPVTIVRPAPRRASARPGSRAFGEGPCVILRSTSAPVQEADLPGSPHFWRAPPGPESIVAVFRDRLDARRDPGLGTRLPPHHRIRPVAWLRLRGGSRQFSGLGRRPRRARPGRLLSTRLFCRLHPGLPVRAVAAWHRRQRAGRNRRPDQAAGDPVRRRVGLARPFDGARARRSAPRRPAGGHRRRDQPGHLVRQCDLGPGGLVRGGVPPARSA